MKELCKINNKNVINNKFLFIFIKIKNILNSIIFNVSLFRTMYIVFSFFEMIVIVDIWAFYTKCTILIWGFCMILYLMKTPDKLKIEYKNIILLFVFLGIVTSFLNISLDFLKNLSFVYHSIICFFIFFGMKHNTSQINIKKEIKFLSIFFVLFSTLFSLIGILILWYKPELCIFGYKIAFSQDRFLGCFTNSNLSAFVSVISIISSNILYDFYLNHTKKIIYKLILNFCILVNILSLFFTDSNASFVYIIVYIIVRVFISNLLKYSYFRKAKFPLEILFLIIYTTIVISASILLRSTSQRLMSYVTNVHKLKNSVPDDYLLKDFDIDKNDNVKLGRQNYDISSGRFILFKQGVEIFKFHPIFGIGRGNLMRFSKYYFDNGLIFSDLHNSYLTILVSYGIIGFTIFAIFCIIIVLAILRQIFEKKYSQNSLILIKLFSGIIAYLAYAMFEKAIFSEISFMSIYFWLILGFAWAFIKK
ncbi:MAG: O-antigen ligase family protein [Candidatus Improbicoccus devescovinae]|nr:MAG: O-antigen ligase family protein [Candidatus Improbicoccus devescovinae]